MVSVDVVVLRIVRGRGSPMINFSANAGRHIVPDRVRIDREYAARMLGCRADQAFKRICTKLGLEREAALRSPIAAIVIAQSEVEAA